MIIFRLLRCDGGAQHLLGWVKGQVRNRLEQLPAAFTETWDAAGIMVSARCVQLGNDFIAKLSLVSEGAVLVTLGSLTAYASIISGRYGRAPRALAASHTKRNIVEALLVAPQTGDLLVSYLPPASTLALVGTSVFDKTTIIDPVIGLSTPMRAGHSYVKLDRKKKEVWVQHEVSARKMGWAAVSIVSMYVPYTVSIDVELANGTVPDSEERGLGVPVYGGRGSIDGTLKFERASGSWSIVGAPNYGDNPNRRWTVSTVAQQLERLVGKDGKPTEKYRYTLTYFQFFDSALVVFPAESVLSITLPEDSGSLTAAPSFVVEDEHGTPGTFFPPPVGALERYSGGRIGLSYPTFREDAFPAFTSVRSLTTYSDSGFFSTTNNANFFGGNADESAVHEYQLYLSDGSSQPLDTASVAWTFYPTPSQPTPPGTHVRIGGNGSMFTDPVQRTLGQSYQVAPENTYRSYRLKTYLPTEGDPEGRHRYEVIAPDPKTGIDRVVRSGFDGLGVYQLSGGGGELTRLATVGPGPITWGGENISAALASVSSTVMTGGLVVSPEIERDSDVAAASGAVIVIHGVNTAGKTFANRTIALVPKGVSPALVKPLRGNMSPSSLSNKLKDMAAIAHERKAEFPADAGALEADAAFFDDLRAKVYTGTDTPPDDALTAAAAAVAIEARFRGEVIFILNQLKLDASAILYIAPGDYLLLST